MFGRHPSEASGLLAAAAAGARGRVEIRDAGDHVDLTDTATRVYAVTAVDVVPAVAAALLAGAGSLAEAERIIRGVTGISETRSEADKARRRGGRPAHVPDVGDLDRIDGIAERSPSGP